MNKKRVILLIVILSILVVTLSITYAYYASGVSGTTDVNATSTTVTSQIGEVEFNGEDTFDSADLDEIYPGFIGVQEFTISPYQDGSNVYEIDLQATVPSTFGNDIKLTLYKTSNVAVNNIEREEGSLTITNDQFVKQDTLTINGTLTKVYEGSLVTTTETVLEQVEFTILNDAFTTPTVTPDGEYTYYAVYEYLNNGDQNSQQGLNFSSKITVKYLGELPLPADTTLGYLNSFNSVYTLTNSDKCAQFAEDGSIINPNTQGMSDSDTPIICEAEDDYGTSYYLRGLHTNNNVKFADSCWKIVRVTGTGGIKMIYNGDVDANGKCTTTSGNHNGFIGQTLDLYGNKLYGTSYTKEGSTYTLTDTSTLNWPNDTSSIIGKYTCNSTSGTCSTLYAVTGEYSSSQGYALKLDQNVIYANIGGSAFNNYYLSSNSTESASPALVGYMYNDTYPNKSKTMTNSGATILSSQSSSSSNFYYGDSISYSGGYYYITNQDSSNVTQLSWAENYESNLVGKYTCRSTSKYDDTTLRCSTAYKVLDTTTKTNYMIAEYLSGGRLAVGTIKISNDFTDNGDGTYTLKDTITEKSAMEWYNGYSSFNNYYVCEDYNQITCNKLYKITSASQTSFETEVGVFNNYYYGSSFTYNESTAVPYTLNNTEQFWDINDSTNKASLNTHHYTCFNASDNTCSEMYYIYYLSGTILSYIKLNGNETGPDALNKMVNNNDINVKNSHIKGAIDWWYEQNLKGTAYESKLEDTVFCNDRTIDDLGGWSETGTLGNYLYFNGGKNKYYLKCPNKRDAFTVSDGEAGNSALTYPVGLLTTAEHSLTGNYTVNKTGQWYWASAPYCFYYSNAREGDVRSAGSWGDGSNVRSAYGARPAVSLRPGTTFKTGGDGSASNPLEVE